MITQFLRFWKANFGRYWLFALALFGGSFVVHAGTAFLRLNQLLPLPEGVDFSAYYSGAWALRLGLSPYSAETLSILRETVQLPTHPPIPPHNSPPQWAFLMIPLTIFSYPIAASLWLLALLGLATWAHGHFMEVAGVSNWRMKLLMLPITLTIGALFLNFTLGQNTLLLLGSAVLIDKLLSRPNQRTVIAGSCIWAMAVAAKLYPAIWIFALGWRGKRWFVGVTGLLFVGTTILFWESSADYWLHFLPAQRADYLTDLSIDDQSLIAWLLRVGRSNVFQFPVVNTDLSAYETVTSNLPWELPVPLLQLITYATLAALAFWMFRADLSEHTRLYALLLFSILPLPHMLRYNLILLLPALALLWQRQHAWLVLGIYGLLAVSRLNHPIAFATPALPAAILSGAGLFGVLLAFVALLRSESHKTTS